MLAELIICENTSVALTSGHRMNLSQTRKAKLSYRSCRVNMSTGNRQKHQAWVALDGTGAGQL